jgi:hypothetical protein
VIRRVPASGDLVLAVVLAAVLLARTWDLPLWKDPSIYHYMAWGIGHGMVPYADTVDPNWPGVLLLHLVGQALSGERPWGMRVVDAGLLAALLATTAVALRRFVPSPLVRAAALLTYFAIYVSDPRNPFGQLLQRDALQLPFLAPFWIACMRRERMGAVALLTVGAAIGFALWMKPTLVVLVAAGFVAAAVCDRRGLPRLAMLVVLGAALVSVPMLAFVIAVCDPRGFWEWAVLYAFGPYAAVRHPFGLAIRYTMSQLLVAGSPLPFAMLVLGYVGIRTRGIALARDEWAPLLASLVWVVCAAAMIVLQGKLFPYHTLPLHWSLTMAGALWLGRAVERRPWPVVERGLVAVATALALGALRFTPPPLDYEMLAPVLRPALEQGDEVVVVGCQPGLLFELQARTPFPEVCSNVVEYFGSPATHARVVRDLATALGDPRVRVVVVEMIDPAFFGALGAELVADAAPALTSLGYARAPDLEPSGTASTFDVYVRK